MAFPTGIGPVFAAVRAAIRQVNFRRQVKLTVRHELKTVSRTGSAFTGVHTHRANVYTVTVIKMSPHREVVVRRVWFETEPPYEIRSPELSVRIKPEDDWKREVRASSVPGEPDKVVYLGRCQLSPDDKVIKSKPEF